MNTLALIACACWLFAAIHVAPHIRWKEARLFALAGYVGFVAFAVLYGVTAI